MIRHLHEESCEFVLDTDNTTYAFRVTKSGHLEHLYYGKRIKIFTADDLIAFTQKREFEGRKDGFFRFSCFIRLFFPNFATI